MPNRYHHDTTMSGNSVLNLTLGVEAYCRNVAGETFTTIANDISVRFNHKISRTSLTNYLTWHRTEIAAQVAVLAALNQPVPAPTRPRWDQPLHVGGSWCLQSDWHVPSHASDFIKRVSELSASWGIRNLALIGDLGNLDGASSFPVPPSEADLDVEFAACRELTGWIGRVFDRCLWQIGNHDQRLMRMTEERLGLSSTEILMLGSDHKWEVSPYGWIEFGDDWLACHPRNVSAIPGRVAQMLAEKYSKHVITAHTHICALSYAKNGKLAIDMGCCCDPARLAYAALAVNTRPKMQQGALILAERSDQPGIYHPYLITPDSDWTALSHLYRPGDLTTQSR